VVGYAYNAVGHHDAFLWEDGVMQCLGSFGGDHSTAYDINASGQVVGWAYTPFDYQHAFLWDNGVMEDIGISPVFLGSHANSVNASGQIAGASSNWQALFWEGGVMYDLNDLVPADSGWHLEEASCINDAGQMVGWGYNGSETHALLLTPIPEPSMVGVFGLALLVVMRRLRRGMNH
jgi:probable HAF family extracellular repeat protein